MKEIFKDIPNYEGLYQASNLGNIKSLPRIKTYSNGNSHITKEIIMKLSNDGKGYLTTGLNKNSIAKSFRVHQLIAITFLNHNPSSRKLVVDHINNIRDDNRLENIQVITQRKNASKDKNKGTSKYVGVHWCKRNRKWVSIIRLNGIKNYLGSYKIEYDAYLAYQEALNNIKR